MEPKTWLTTREAAEYIGYSSKSVTRFCRDGSLQHSRGGHRGAYRFRKSWLDAFLTPVPNRAFDSPPVRRSQAIPVIPSLDAKLAARRARRAR